MFAYRTPALSTKEDLLDTFIIRRKRCTHILQSRKASQPPPPKPPFALRHKSWTNAWYFKVLCSFTFFFLSQEENRYHEDIFGITLKTAEVTSRGRAEAKNRKSTSSSWGLSNGLFFVKLDFGKICNCSWKGWLNWFIY